MWKVVCASIIAAQVGILGVAAATPVIQGSVNTTVQGVEQATGFFDNMATGRVLPLIVLSTLIGMGVGVARADDRGRGALGGGLVGGGAGVIIGAASPEITRTILTGFSADPVFSTYMLPVEPDLFLRNPVTVAIFLLVPFALAALKRRRTMKEASHVE